MSHARRPEPRRKRRLRWGFAVIAVLVFGLIAGTALYVAADRTATAPGPATPAPPAPGAPAVMGPAAPTSLTVPALKVTSTLLPLGLQADNTLATPPLSQPMQASWYDGSPQPGTRGPAIVLGHVDGNGKPGIFHDLPTLKPGAEIDVARADHTVAVFTVDHVDTVKKTSFPGPQVFANTPDAELRLVSCTGSLDTTKHSYDQNVIAWAHLVGQRAG